MATLALASALLAMPGCIQPNPDYLGQGSTGGNVSTIADPPVTISSTEPATQGATTIDSMSGGASSDDGSDTSEEGLSSTGPDPTTGEPQAACADGSGGFCYLSPTCIAVSMEPTRTTLGDLDGDDDLDVVVVGRMPDTVEGLLNDGMGALAADFSAEVGRRPDDVVLLDLNGARHLVIAARDDNAVELHPLNGGELGDVTEYSVGNRPAALALADVSGDPRLDVVVAVRDANAFVVLEAQPDGTLSALDPHPVGERPEDVAVGDVDGDGELDIVTANDMGGGISITFGEGGGVFFKTATIEVSPMGRAVALGDLDGTSGLDIASVASSVDGVSLLATMGNVVAPAVTVPAGMEPQDVLARDLNNDGLIDLAVAHAGESSLYVFAGQGNGTFGAPLSFGLSADGFAVSAGDLNGDGVPDLVATAPDAGQICVVLSSLEG